MQKLIYSTVFLPALQMLAAIGETFETPYGRPPSPDMPFTDEVTGVIVSSRKGFYRISIWTRSSDTKAKVEDIGKHFKFGVLGTTAKVTAPGYATDVEFQSHRDSQVSRSCCITCVSHRHTDFLMNIQVRGKKPAFTV